MPSWSKLSWSKLSREEQKARLSELIRSKLRTPPTSIAAATRVRSNSSGGSTKQRP